MNDSSRRSFIKKLTGSTAAMAIGTSVLAGDKKEQYLEFLSRTKYSANDNINIALIGAGIPETRAVEYERGLKEGGIVLGTRARDEAHAAELERDLRGHGARNILL